MNKPDRWMPLDWGDYWRDTGHLKAAEHGAYLNLLGHYWVSGKPLPDDDARLHRLAKTTRAEWQRLGGTVRAFFTVRDGALHHKRVEREIARATDLYAKRYKSAEVMREKKAQKHLKQSTPSPSQTHDSVPAGTGADAPAGEGGVLDDGVRGETQSASAAAPSTESLKARIFGPCLAWLAAHSTLPEPSARKITARWCAAHGDGAVLHAFSLAARQSPLDPVPYIEKVLNNGAPHTSSLHGPKNSTYAARVAQGARHQAAGHLSGLRDALGLGAVASVRAAADGTDVGLIIDADEFAP